MRIRFIVSMALIAGAGTAFAEVPSNVIIDAPGVLQKGRKADLPDVKATPQAWPRLDPGSALCKTPDDLTRLAANRAHTEGGGQANCQIMHSPTAIDIVQRAAPGRTQVRLRDRPAAIGWTDVWLPERAPAGR